MALTSGLWLLPGHPPVRATFLHDGTVQLELQGTTPAKVIGYYTKFPLSEQEHALLVAASETGNAQEISDLRPLLLAHMGQGVWRCNREKQTIFISDPPHRQVLNLTPPDLASIRFSMVWFHPGKPVAVLWLRRDGQVEYSTDLQRRNVDKRNGEYVIKGLGDASERTDHIEELEVTFHYDGVSSQAETTILQPLNESGVFRATGTKHNGKRKHFDTTWQGEQLKQWHVVAILRPIVM